MFSPLSLKIKRGIIKVTGNRSTDLTSLCVTSILGGDEVSILFDSKADRTKRAGLIALSLLSLSFLPDLNALAQNYQSVEPKLDSAPAESHPLTNSAQKSAATLQGSVFKVDKHQKKTGKFLGGARKGQTDALKARVKDEGALRAQAQSSIGIIGVKFVATLGKPPVINEVFPNTPADKVGLRVYDVIVAVDGVPTSGLTKDEVFDLIVGTPGTQVNLSILRNGDYSAYSCTRMDINELLDPRIRRDYMIHM